MKDNKLIAEFMGAGCDKKTFFITGKKVYFYDTSWDWLMPVVDKCTQIGFRDTDTDDNPLYELWDRLFCDNMGQFVGNHIDEVYNSVVEFIKEYNK